MTLNSCRGFPLFAYYRKTTKKEVCKHILTKTIHIQYFLRQIYIYSYKWKGCEWSHSLNEDTFCRNQLSEQTICSFNCLIGGLCKIPEQIKMPKSPEYPNHDIRELSNNLKI